jgi:hypothetical protein
MVPSMAKDREEEEQPRIYQRQFPSKLFTLPATTQERLLHGVGSFFFR